MEEVSFASRVRALGLKPKPEDMEKLEALAKDMERAAMLVRGPRSYAEEPLAAFRFPKA